jgi:hypothetical protein
LLVAQFAYAYAAEEPFPSFVFPSFRGAPDHNGPARVLRPRLVVRFADSDRAVDISYQRLLAPAPGFVADAIAYSVFAPFSASARPRSTPALFRLFLKQPAVARGKQTPSAELRDPRTRSWLRRRLAQLYPGRAAEFLTMVWDEHRYVVHDASVAETVTTVSRLRLPLQE